MNARVCVCDIRELPTVQDLRAWAAAHRARVTYLGPTLEGQPLYGASRGPVTRVARECRPDPHPHRLVWASPLEHLAVSR
ncbi:hypothetical protein [Nocardiopsis deserti]|uniref:hypothetical protein n=1 Tax=Nocardiopsis deserti TaxID=2605988 RepID=UPI001CC23CC0|nr:hypothetical protein [Nocardiopsis deserti]